MLFNEVSDAWVQRLGSNAMSPHAADPLTSLRLFILMAILVAIVDCVALHAVTSPESEKDDILENGSLHVRDPITSRLLAGRQGRRQDPGQ